MYSYAKVRYTNQSSIRVNTFELNGKYQVTPNLLGGLAFIYGDGSVGATALSGITKDTKPRWLQVNAGGGLVEQAHGNVPDGCPPARNG